MRLSIVMSTYNGEKYISDQIASIAKQTRAADEVIICDDGSSDKTVEIIGSYISNNGLEETWSLIENETNKGCVLNFLDGARKANGDIIFYSDQDDVWDLHKLELMEMGFIENPDMLACCCLLHFMDENGKDMPMTHKFMTSVRVRTKWYQRVSLAEAIRYNKSPGLCLAIKRELIEETRSLILKDGLAHDLPIGLVAAVRGGYFILNQELVRYRQHNNNLSNANITLHSRMSSVDRQIAGRRVRLRLMQSLYREYNSELSPKDRRNLSDAIQKTGESVRLLEEDNVVGLAFMLFDSNPMLNRWISLNNLLTCLMNLTHRKHRV